MRYALPNKYTKSNGDDFWLKCQEKEINLYILKGIEAGPASLKDKFAIVKCTYPFPKNSFLQE
jgi:hypothetical protein